MLCVKASSCTSHLLRVGCTQCQMSMVVWDCKYLTCLSKKFSLFKQSLAIQKFLVQVSFDIIACVFQSSVSQLPDRVPVPRLWNHFAGMLNKVEKHYHMTGRMCLSTYSVLDVDKKTFSTKFEKRFSKCLSYATRTSGHQTHFFLEVHFLLQEISKTQRKTIQTKNVA